MDINHPMDCCNLSRSKTSSDLKHQEENAVPAPETSLPLGKHVSASKSAEFQHSLEFNSSQKPSSIHNLVNSASRQPNRKPKQKRSSNLLTKSDVLAFRELGKIIRFNVSLHVMPNSGDDHQRMQKIRDILQKIIRAVKRFGRSMSYFTVYEKPLGTDLHAHILLKIDTADIAVLKRRVREDKILIFKLINEDQGGLMGAVNYATKYRRDLCRGEWKFSKRFNHYRPTNSDGSIKTHRKISARSRFAMSNDLRSLFQEILENVQAKQAENNAAYKLRNYQTEHVLQKP